MCAHEHTDYVHMPYADTLGEKPAGISPLDHGREYKHVNISWNQSIVEL